MICMKINEISVGTCDTCRDVEEDWKEIRESLRGDQYV